MQAFFLTKPQVLVLVVFTRWQNGNLVAGDVSIKNTLTKSVNSSRVKKYWSIKEKALPTTTITRTYRIHTEDTQALLIDMQDKFVPHIHEMEKITNKARILIAGLNALDVPLTVNEQYPKGLGHTIAELSAVFGDVNVFEKSTFSSVDDESTWRHLAMQNRHHVLLFGIETHVCVQQTALDLLDNGMQPVIISDATSSRDPYDRKIALRRMRRAGAVVTTTEAILFELLRSSKHPDFKVISHLVK